MPPRPYLADIVAAHRAAAAADRRDLHALEAEARRAGPTRGFIQALRRSPVSDGHRPLAVVAEIKRRSPSKGDLDVELDPATVAAEYAAGGARCLSVLTDADAFGGSAADLDAARSACNLPVLRKDFTVAPADIYDARLMGADALLLIVAALADGELAELHQLSASIGIDVLIEVHDEAELERALALSPAPSMVGVNQRDLQTFEVDPERALRLADSIPAGVVAVAESGIGSPADAEALAVAGYDAVLVGESLVRAADRSAAVRELAALPAARRTGPVPAGS